MRSTIRSIALGILIPAGLFGQTGVSNGQSQPQAPNAQVQPCGTTANTPEIVDRQAKKLASKWGRRLNGIIVKSTYGMVDAGDVAAIAQQGAAQAKPKPCPTAPGAVSTPAPGTPPAAPATTQK
jgi:hypothetical protein